MTVRKLLIANRGEIACRIMETASRMGIVTVAVHSDVDADARHVAMADEAVLIGGASPGESYLNIDAVLDAARRTGAGLIHPGYGFLSENPDFVEAVEAAGLIFVGPSAHAIRSMGLKDEAKRLMQDAGVPVVPGYHGEDQTPEVLAKAAEDIGYPVLIKAVAGGGGKGMRIVEDAKDFVPGLDAAKAEARGAFGNDRVLIEKLVQKPRHIEVQIFGDGADAVHLFERDCSLQRRHQKVIEEAPAPGMTDEMRAAMGAAAVQAAKAVAYKGAGTVEFIVDASEGLRPDRFWFMEMNTRLQVEHPVTEEITGVDLVEWQLRVALGEPLPAKQEELSISGHAMEARIYAEDASIGFLPATGQLEHLTFPPNARIDTGVRAGDAITPHYDPMIAKLTVHGQDRGDALSKMASALEATEIAGTVTNISFLGRLVALDAFQSGDVDTGVIARAGEALLVEPDLDEVALAVAAVTFLGITAGSMQGFALWAPLQRRVRTGEHSLIVEPTVAGAIVRVGGAEVKLRYTDGFWSDAVSGRRHRSMRTKTGVAVFGGGGGRVVIADPLDRDGGVQSDDVTVAPMPGKVTAVSVAVGDTVEPGTVLAILEAMKMEHRLTASRAGQVAEVSVAEGDQISAGDVMIRLEEE
ncbi:MAG: biotin/lipoyl-binding protein [Boseongicola sp.]|nr:biotin/lipoyl-binding protein [Boseongicola sp.]MDD9976169.1 biotin/lipoyl-binding protein [Boseongicola sp.]